jgi:hypothetical protein
MSKERLTAEEMLSKSGFLVSVHEKDREFILDMFIKPLTEVMQAFAAQEVEAAIAETKKQRDELLKKQQEYIEAQDKQIKLITGDLPLVDAEGFGYHALAISQNLTKIERELNELRNH